MLLRKGDWRKRSRRNVYSHAEAQRAQSSRREFYYFPLIMFFSPADYDNLGPAEMAERAEILITI